MNTLTRMRAGALAGLAALACLVTGAIFLDTAGANSSGGIGTTAASADDTDDRRDVRLKKYDRLWDRVSVSDRRWARKTAECESGRDPNALGAGGLYRGAFQFLMSSWKAAPKTPGGDPIDYNYRTQAVVAVALKKQLGTKPWPVCG